MAKQAKWKRSNFQVEYDSNQIGTKVYQVQTYLFCV